MNENELKRFYCLIEYVSESNMVHLILYDSNNLRNKFSAVTTVEKLEEQGLKVHVDKNFHLVINRDGSWNIYWIRNVRLTSEEENIRRKVFDEFLELYYQHK